ncbi:MAG: hypothetical protein RLZZ210_1089 [Pseudomonadota bacterium]
MKKKISIVILDFGSQFTQLIARRIREFGVYCEIFPYDIELSKIQAYKPNGIILSGGPNSVNDVDSPKAPDGIFDLNIPILGVCYGMQTMAVQLGGSVISGGLREFGYAKLGQTDKNLSDDLNFLLPLFASSNNKNESFANVWMSHGDKVSSLPKDFECLAYTNTCSIAAMGNLDKKLFGVQFHPEVTHTNFGMEFLQNFVLNICKCDNDWQMDSIIEKSVQHIRDTVGDKSVLLGLSGGVDSSVAAAIIHKAIGDKLTCVFVDNGLLRLNERTQVEQVFAQNLGVKVITVDAGNYFLSNLVGISDPEQKRKSIGKSFIDIFELESNKLTDIEFLAQGTIYPDVIESAGAGKKTAHTIKSHHNVGGLPEHMKLKLLEPLRDLFKDEVRKLGVALGLPSSMVYRHPFPGPGLGVRILGEIKQDYVNLLQKADAIFIHELNNTFATQKDVDYGLCNQQDIGKSWYDLTSQAFTVFLPVKSVGVMGDGRTYDYVVALRAVQTVDFMTAHWAKLPYDLLGHVSNRIINEVKGINRVTYDISGKPPATIEWE